jgi:hypothetical protein
MNTRAIFIFIVLVLLPPGVSRAQYYPDQHYTLTKDSLPVVLTEVDGLTLGSETGQMMLQDGRTDGYAILRPQQSLYPFNHGLPSWNGSAMTAVLSEFRSASRTGRAGHPG